MGSKRVVITGGAGFIGSHLAESLLKDGYSVVCVDNFATGRKENLANLEVELVDADVTKKFGKLAGTADYVFNLASPASPVDYQKLSIETLLVGSIGMKNVLDYSEKCGARLLQASTSEIYGDPIIHPQAEVYWGNVNPIGVRSCYDEAKRYSEALCMAYFRKKKVEGVLARIFNTYGPRMRLDDGRAVPNFVGQALRGEPLTVYGDGKHTRSFCYVSDMVDGLKKLMFSGLGAEAYNVGNPEEYTVLEFAEIIRKLTGTKSKIVFGAIPEDDPKRRKPDITKIALATGWKPKVKVEEGLKKTIEWFKDKM